MELRLTCPKCGKKMTRAYEINDVQSYCAALGSRLVQAKFNSRSMKSGKIFFCAEHKTFTYVSVIKDQGGKTYVVY